MTDDPKKVAVGSVEFFIGELERTTSEADRRYASLVRRIAELEAKAKGGHEDAIMGQMGTLFMVLIGLQLLPMLLDMVKTWRSSSSSSLSV